MRPRMFQLVKSYNEKIVNKAMLEMPEGEQIIIKGFRYPLISLGSSPASHNNGIFRITLPGSPARKDKIFYDRDGKIEQKDLRKLADKWYYYESPY